MKTKILFSLSFLLVVIIFSGCTVKESIKDKPETPLTLRSITENFLKDFSERKLNFEIPRGSRIDTVITDSIDKNIHIYISDQFAGIPFRKNMVDDIYSSVKNYYGASFADYNYKIYSLNNIPIEDLIPNYYRTGINEYDESRLPLKTSQPTSIIRNLSKPVSFQFGLTDRNILLWHSHGWYYSNGSNRWEWQRPRMFQSVEDKIPMSFVIPYLIPMLENAGANVFVPRERDIQKNEVVVDNDSQNKMYLEESFNSNYHWQTGTGNGFAVGKPPYPSGLNPFKQGTFRFISTDTSESAQVSWIPEIPEEGFYGVYVSYSASDQNADDAHYMVYHSGGKTEFLINQQMGGSTWIWLGSFKFNKGFNSDEGKVVLTNKSKSHNKTITADAVRFGGGMGIVERNGSTSGRPKFLEGARYWLQYAGMPDTLVYLLNNDRNDYNDDYQSRSEYGNYLYGSPYGPNRNRSEKGLGIPLDLSLAFHTDAGITSNDTTVGTLSIYSLESTDSQFVFPDGVSRMANRDFADILQTQITDDLRFKYDSAWNRRDLRHAQYSENTRPNVPSALLELLSHQNFLDMQFVLDPSFRFDVARAVYKAMLRFLSAQYNFQYTIQPLPVTHFSSEFNSGRDILLKWKPQPDPLEPSAVPDKYVVYVRKDGGDFNNGIVVYDTAFVFRKPEHGVVYSFKVTAVNDGGESFPSEILSVCNTGNMTTAIIINGFDRVAPPAAIKGKEFSGFMNVIDAGVPDKYMISFTGEQYDFDTSSKYISNDAPGHGASHGDYETKIIAGNTFDYPFVHGKAIKSAGYSFISASDESVWERIVDIKEFKFVDLILGEEKETHRQKAYADSVNGTRFKAFPVELQNVLSDYALSGGNIFVSGAYIGSDLYSDPADSNSIKFANDVLKFKLASGHGAKTGVVKNVSQKIAEPDTIIYNVELSDKIYAVEAPDAINNTKESEMLFRYTENQFGACVGYKKNYGVVALGFPFETIKDEQHRSQLMLSIVKYFGL